jgi:diguanylate cyclase (GGDEF)-like protein
MAPPERELAARLVLRFTVGTGGEEAALWQTEFHHRQFAPGGRRTARGQDEGAHAVDGTFQWTAAVKVLTAYLLRCAAWGQRHPKGRCGDTGPDAECPALEGRRASPAATLNYAMSKKTQWLCDMFGTDGSGSPFLLELIRRSNADLKREGEPVLLRLDVGALPPGRIEVVADGRRLANPEEIERLAGAIDASCRPRDRGRSRVVLTIRGNLAEDWTPERRRSLRRALEEAGIRNCDIVSAEEGSIRLTLELPAEEAERLFWAVHSGHLNELGVIGFKFVPAPALPWKAKPHLTAGRRCSLLVVDDEPYILPTLSALLAGSFDVVTAESAEAAQQIIAAQDVDLVLTDQRMPGMTGTQLLEWVREHSPNTVRLLMTGYAELEDAIEAINRGHVYHYLLKPWRTEELGQVLRNAAEKFELERSREELFEELRRLNLGLEQRVADRTKELQEANHLLQQRTRDLEMLALTDPLTALLNRRAIEDVARSELRRHARYRSPLALGVIDADHFREINHRHLLPGGDAVLVHLGRTLTRSLRTVDSVGRIGGEEFLVVAPETNHEGAIHLAGRIRAMVEGSRTTYKDQVIDVTVSIGFAVVESGIAEYDHVKYVASAALSEAKAGGRNRAVVRVVS